MIRLHALCPLTKCNFSFSIPVCPSLYLSLSLPLSLAISPKLARPVSLLIMKLIIMRKNNDINGNKERAKIILLHCCGPVAS